MHEFSIMTQIVNAIIEETEKNNLKSVEEVHLDIGTLTFLGEDQIRFAYEVLIKDNILRASNLIINEKKPKIECESCEYIGNIKYENIGDTNSMHLSFPKFSCPKCNKSVKILEGNECTITKIIGNIEED